MPTPEPRVMALIVLGNDGHLSPYGWRDFHIRARQEIEAAGATLCGEWFAAPLALYENASMLIELAPGIADRLKEVLAEVGRDYGPNSLAWYEVVDDYRPPRPAWAESSGKHSILTQ